MSHGGVENAAASPARGDLLSQADYAWGAFLNLLGLLACLLIAIMVLVICADVVVRNLGWGNLPWATEIAEYTLYLSTFLAAPWLLRSGAHVRLDLVLKALPHGIAWWLELVTDVIAIITCASLAVASANATFASATQGSLIFKILVFPEWWLLAPAAVLFGVLAIEFFWRLRRQWNGPRAARQEATSVA